MALEIEKIAKSKIADVDFNNLKFGQIFTDHMFECDFENGEWQTPKIRPYQPLLFDPSAKVFHYGQAVFEGMKAYKDDKDDLWLFRPDENQKRINISAERLDMPAFPKDYFFEGLTTLLKMDKDWVKTGEDSALYIRPFIIATENCVSASSSNKYKFMIICSPVQAYYSGEVKVVFADKYSRSANGGVGFAKAAGNYAGSFYPTKLANQDGFQQVVWTDASTHEFLEEAGVMNVFFRVNDTLLTAPTSERILDGVTRKSIIQFAEDKGIKVDVRPVRVSEIVEAARKGELLEMFGAGTAAVISPINAFSNKGEVFDLPKIENSYASLIKKGITDIQKNKAEDKFGWRVKVQ
ncbi:MAG: branched-chain amino acid aminotransferase [Lutibacter sp.]|jgi:branched-chain amino acid aminotransferase|uniref:branched-chain amino acid aminotransferase n=1 Tax=Lutibacter sp. TaxID=1925666 RepID=UPI0017CE341A|nr:branched-chain amino acid aminotransferase [Lutibacter sp.]MBT8318290.1 branched-chain amino acid aminotransferase [Lutibacter sp.]NNJ59147.1 branched-chain amino acid aminotransferase [Lutibacter sp.]